MMKMTLKLLLSILLGFKKTSDPALENLALRQQLTIMTQCKQRPQFRSRDRLFYVLLSCIWSNWRDALVVVKPDTVVRWHKKGFKSRSRGPGRPPISPEIRDLVRKTAKANLLWGAPRIHDELHHRYEWRAAA